MNKTRRRELKDVNNEDLFSLFKEYTRRIITEDLEDIYERKAHLLYFDEPWVFQMEG